MTPTKIPSLLAGVAGEYYVAAELSRRGFIASISLRNTRGMDTCSDVRGFRGAKLRFRDPDESERLGEDQFLFLWLTGVHYHPVEKLFSGTFFEVPREFQKWHKVGDRLGFDPEDIFDWMMLTEEGRLFGGFTLRVSRALLPEFERADYDKHVGVRVYEEEA